MSYPEDGEMIEVELPEAVVDAAESVSEETGIPRPLVLGYLADRVVDEDVIEDVIEKIRERESDDEVGR